MKYLKIFILSFFIIANLFAQEKNMLIKLDGEWLLKLDPQRVGQKEKWFEEKTPSNFEKVKVPGFFENQINKEFDGWIWYFKNFTLNKSFKKAAIIFEGVDDDAVIYLNGQKIGEHQGYSEKFYFDISKYLKKGINFLVVLVNDNGGPGGIYKSVYIKSYTNEVDLLKSKYADKTARESLDWVKKGIIYEIFPRAFSKEGNFNGVINRLEQLKELGVTILWIMPIHPIGEVKRKGTLGSPYSVKNYYEINPEYGTKEEFRILVNKAHQLGMKVIIDMVLNHCAWDNPLVKEHPEWFTKDKDGNFISPISDWSDVVDFDYNNKELRKFMINMLKYWVQEFDIDGFRFDVSELVPLDFWVEARKELEKIKKQFWLSEGTLPEHHIYAFDMTYSWNIYDQLKPLLEGKRSKDVIIKVLDNEKYMFPKNSLRMRFNENHDKRRATEVFGEDGAFLTAALIFSLPGIPLIHNGQEVGEKVWSSLFEKTEINWNNYRENEFFKFFKGLTEFRKKNFDLVLGELKRIEISDKLVAFMNTKNSKGIFAIFNLGENKETVDLNFIDELKGYKYGMKDLIGRKFRLDEERMGRPANKIIEIDRMGFVLIQINE